MKKNELLTVRHYFEKKPTSNALIIAHRGGAKSFSNGENTLDVFLDAIQNQVKMIEFDVRRTKDSQYIIFHDNKVDRKKISSLTYSELAEICSHKNIKVPLLIDTLQLCSKRVLFDIELKETGYEREVIEIISNYIDPSHYVITSFHDSVIRTIKQINPDIYTGLLLGKDKATPLEHFSELFPFGRLKKSKADFVVPNYKLVTPWLVYKCRKLNYHIYVWTVNKNNVYLKLMKHKVTAIITDYPDRFSGNY
ncbi:glycerophosphodiester phosphodiesterase [Anaeromicropila populeti]|uniref:Glycerophosphoryl diester phosphodiesterase n=1 Tax=Anaeromicropila populeti TaxID=37658 RepID=A0A1I6KR77_9FIRM|nr:glycerophosphodiester phosphodiesterase [Anaeromicropila populeti]SFR93749.1 glycerophosphoryl diester phosphodiesterase [Anaeromicropila populeti]